MEQNNLMLKLFEKESMHFQEVVDTCIPNRKRAQAIQAELIKKKLIQQENKNWCPGQKKIYSLTEKGVLHCHQLDINRINESLKRLQLSSSWLRSNPSRIKEALTNQRNDIFLKNFSGKKLTTEQERDFFTKMRAPDAPLLDIFRNMHEIIRQEFVELFKNKELSTSATVIKDGAMYLVKAEDLKSDKLIPFPI